MGKRRCRTCMSLTATIGVCSLLSWLWVASAWGDPGTRLINTDTARTLEDGQWQFAVDFRTFDNPDDQQYVSSRIAYAKDGIQYDIIGSFSSRATHTTSSATLLYGGTNWEIRAKKQLTGGDRAVLSAIAGLEFPNTPAQDDVHLAVHLPLTLSRCEKGAVHIVPTFVFLEDNTISALGLGADYQLSDRLSLMAEVTPILGGDNTRDASGALKDDNLWGVALRWAPCSERQWTIDVGFTNGKGQTSSFAVAPGILDSTAFCIAATGTW